MQPPKKATLEQLAISSQYQLTRVIEERDCQSPISNPYIVYVAEHDYFHRAESRSNPVLCRQRLHSPQKRIDSTRKEKAPRMGPRSARLASYFGGAMDALRGKPLFQ